MLLIYHWLVSMLFLWFIIGNTCSTLARISGRNGRGTLFNFIRSRSFSQTHTILRFQYVSIEISLLVPFDLYDQVTNSFAWWRNQAHCVSWKTADRNTRCIALYAFYWSIGFKQNHKLTKTVIWNNCQRKKLYDLTVLASQYQEQITL